MGAGDTFRAAAVEQLSTWGDRLGIPVVRGAHEAKPSTVAYEALEAAKKQGADILLLDTAGRLHTKSSLMQELEGIRNALRKQQPSAPHHVILVVDGSTGQNALAQAREFNAATGLTGLVVTKLDGTAKGGIVVAICDEIGVPVEFVGVGEHADALKRFEPAAFADALLGAGKGASPDVSAEELGSPSILH
jgi:fused signal recognition particle receptor